MRKDGTSTSPANTSVHGNFSAVITGNDNWNENE